MLSRMIEDTRLPRSPELMSRGDTALLVIDVQEKLLPAIADGPRVVWNVRRLIDAAYAGLSIASVVTLPFSLSQHIIGDLVRSASAHRQSTHLPDNPKSWACSPAKSDW